MTETQTATQAGTDAETYAAYLANGESKAAAARALGIQPGTVTARIKRHLARTAQDEAAEQVSYAADPANPTDDELAAAIQRGLADGTLVDSADWMAQHAAAVAAGDAIAEAAPAITETVRNAEISDQQPAAEPASPVKGEKATECADCGFQFSKPQARTTCQSAAACQKRQAARHATA